MGSLKLDPTLDSLKLDPTLNSLKLDLHLGSLKLVSLLGSLKFDPSFGIRINLWTNAVLCVRKCPKEFEWKQLNKKAIFVTKHVHVNTQWSEVDPCIQLAYDKQ